MSNLISMLKNLTDPIKIAIVGTGSMGKGLFYQSCITPGIKCIALADIVLERAIACAEWMQQDYRVVHTLATMHETVRQGLIAVCEDGNLLASCEFVDVFIEASNSIIPAGQFSVSALKHGKHLVLMNSEIDLVFGPYLLHLAQDNRVVYTSCGGDQHGVIKGLIDELQLWGFDLVMAGNIKGFLDRYSNPTKIIPEADKRNLDYKMATAYTDGTKLCIEMALVANAFGCITSIPGMQGLPTKHVRDVLHLFDFATLWENRQPVVDYILGAEPGGGVFIIGYCENDYQQSMLSYYKMGNGPFYLLYRPYHLCHIEAIACIAEAFLNKHSLLQPLYGFQTDVYAYAKRDLQRGEKLDGIGGYRCYGLIENRNQNDSYPGLPICLAEDVSLKRDVLKDEKIFLADVNYDPLRSDYTLYYKSLEHSNLGKS